MPLGKRTTVARHPQSSPSGEEVRVPGLTSINPPGSWLLVSLAFDHGELRAVQRKDPAPLLRPTQDNSDGTGPGPVTGGSRDFQCLEPTRRLEFDRG